MYLTRSARFAAQLLTLRMWALHFTGHFTRRADLVTGLLASKNNQ